MAVLLGSHSPHTNLFQSLSFLNFNWHPGFVLLCELKAVHFDFSTWWHRRVCALEDPLYLITTQKRGFAGARESPEPELSQARCPIFSAEDGAHFRIDFSSARLCSMKPWGSSMNAADRVIPRFDNLRYLFVMVIKQYLPWLPINWKHSPHNPWSFPWSIDIGTTTSFAKPLHR
jgi:hypothetical protein